MKIDLHVHSHFSHDGRMSPRALITAARRAGLSGVAVCDHDTLAGSLAAQAACPSDFVVIPGAEYSTDQGHVLAYFITEAAEDAALPRMDNGCFILAPLAEFVKAQGGLLVAAHPFLRRVSLPAPLLREVHGLEVFNARQMARQPAGQVLWEARRMGGLLTAGSDAHLPGELGGAYMEIDAQTPQEVRTALTEGRYSCHGRPARRRYEALGRLGQHGAFGLPKDLARLAVFVARDIKDMFSREELHVSAEHGGEHRE